MGITPLGGGPGGLTGGIAQGQIRIDTHSLALDRAQVVREARLMAEGMRGVGDAADKGVKQADNAFSRLSHTMNNTWRTTTLIIAAIAGMGVKSAQSVKMLDMRIRILSGSQKAAVQNMADMREMAEDLQQPFMEIAEGATSVLPALRGTNASLTETLMLAQRLAIMDPVQGITGASLAIREFLSGEYISLVKRLELDRKRLRAIRDEADGDQAKMIRGLSDYIAEIGATNEDLKAMGESGVNTFRVLRSEGTETLATFFEPLLTEVVIPLTRAFGDFLRELRRTSPELKKFIGIAAGLGGISALASRGLPLIGQVPGGAMLGKAGLYGGALYGGAQLGGYIARKAGLPGTEGKSQQEVMSDAWKTFKQAVFLGVSALAQLAKGVITVWEIVDSAGFDLKDAWRRVIDTLNDAVNDLLDLIDRLPGVDIKRPKELPANAPGMGTSKLNQPGAALPPGAERYLAARQLAQAVEFLGGVFQTSGNQAEQAATKGDKYRQMIDDLLITIGEDMGVIDQDGANMFQNLRAGLKDAADAAREAGPALEDTGITITDELLDAFRTYKEDVQAIETEMNEALLDETEDYEQRKADLIRNFADDVARMLEEENIRYARALADTQRKEQDIRANQAEELVEASEDMAESLTDLNAEYFKEQQRATEDHLRSLRDIERDGKESIRRAAMKLDAVGVFEAARNMEKRLADEKEGFATEQDRRLEDLNETIEAEKAHYAERLQLTQDNADQQIQELWEQFNREEQQRGEDNARKMMQMQTAHQQEMMELGTEHQAKLTDIRNQAAVEKAEREKDWIKEFNAAQTHQGNMLVAQKQGQAAMEAELKAWWDKMAGEFAARRAAITVQQAATAANQWIGQTFLGRQTGGRLSQTGLFRGERDEEVLRPDVARTLRRMFGGEIPQSGLVPALAGGGLGGGGSLSMGDVIINVPENFTGDWEMLGNFVQEKIVEAWKGARR